MLKKKEKPKRNNFFVSLVASEIESEEEASKAKKKSEFARVVRKLQSSGAQQSKKVKFDPALARRP